MCGRIALYTPPARLARLLEAAIAAGVETTSEPSWNVSPQRTLFGVADRGDGRVLDGYTWGLVPWFAKDAAASNRMFNARAETMASRSAFRGAFERQRLLVPVDGFFEWDRRGGSRDPHFFTRSDGDVLVLAGLYERWRDPAGPPDAPRRTTCTVVTTTPGPDLDGIHDRMPVVLERDGFDLWLTGADDELDAVQGLCAPASRGTLVHHLVGSRVGNVRNDGPELIAAVAANSTLFDQLGEQ
jgi:putative SOS response-associated peptidase YedK